MCPILWPVVRLFIIPGSLPGTDVYEIITEVQVATRDKTYGRYNEEKWN